MRLYRLGYRCGVIACPTYEDAPVTAKVWMRQRTRWFKGWLQTWLVMMRDPAKLPVEMGVAGCVSFQLLIGGMLISSLAHPWLIMFMAASIGYALSGPPGMTTLEGFLFLFDLLNLLGSYVLFLLLGRVMMVREERKNVGWRWIALPVYWLMLSAAAWRAVFELPYKPFFWDKTPHNAAHAGQKLHPGSQTSAAGGSPQYL